MYSTRGKHIFSLENKQNKQNQTTKQNKNSTAGEQKRKIPYFQAQISHSFYFAQTKSNERQNSQATKKNSYNLATHNHLQHYSKFLTSRALIVYFINIHHLA